MSWSEPVEEVFGGDQAIMLAYVTPARGVVLTPVVNFAVRDRQAGTLTAANSSVGAWRKLERIRRNPNVALAYHTRELGFTDRPEYVLVQGKASLTAPDADYPRSIRDNWERYGSTRDVGPLWEWWLKVYHWRVGIEIAVERVIVWPDLGCRGVRSVEGTPLPLPPPPPQSPPRNGTGPRIDHRRAARRAGRLPYTLLGWVGADGFPMVVPVEIASAGDSGIALEAPHALVPPGARRAGLTAHWFTRHSVGQEHRTYTGWLDADPESGRLVYAPHTVSGLRLPGSLFVFRLTAGLGTRWWLRGARKAGIV